MAPFSAEEETNKKKIPKQNATILGIDFPEVAIFSETKKDVSMKI